ncbi:MAG: sigma-70 family RNA polymerase sigma factor [Treponema sp.]|jgi:RNA polymerase sigma-70 factor (ECF subfamily)|nr:sigma-70 family RNA polymerase sigma factor [Treponema sp.]
MAVDVAAWYEKYGPMVIRRCRALLRNDEEAMDAVQDVFVNLIGAQQRLKASYPSSLLYTMATNLCLNMLRARKGERLLSEEFFAAEGGYEPATEAEGRGSPLAQVDAELLVKAILEDESEGTRVICYMYHADGMTLKEIGEAVGLSVSGVRKKLETFRRRARLKLGEEHK